MTTDNQVESTGSISVAACGCPQLLVLLKDSSATFTGLSPEEEYFPMVSRVAPQSFFGFPPSPLRPIVPRQNAPGTPKTDAPPTTPASAKSKETTQGDFHDLRDTSHDDDESANSFEGLNVGSSQARTSGHSSTSSTTNNSACAGTPASKRSFANTQDPRRDPINIELQVRELSFPNMLPPILTNTSPKAPLDEELQRSEVEVERLEEEHAMAQASVASLTDEVSRLIVSAREVAGNRLRIDSITQAEKKAIRVELTALTDNCNEKTRQLQVASTENQSQRQQLAENEQALESLRLSIREKEQQQERLRASLEDARTRLASLQNEIEPLRRNDENARAEIERLNVDVQHLRTQNEKLSDDLESAERDIENARQLLQGRKRARDAEQEQEAAAKRTKI